MFVEGKKPGDEKRLKIKSKEKLSVYQDFGEHGSGDP